MSPRAARILVVDDEPRMAQIIGRALELVGHEAAVYADPHMAIDALANGFAHDLIIADRRMPGVGGEEIARWAKALRPNFPVILMSRHAPYVSGAERVDGVLAKPFTITELLAVVDRALASVNPAN